MPFSPSIKAKKLLTYGVRDGIDEVWDKKRVENMINLLNALEAYSSMQVKYMDARNQDDVYIMLDDYLIRFGKVDETGLARAKKIASILPEAQKNKDKLKYIDLRWEDSCYLRLEGVKEITPEIKNIQKDKVKQQKPENDEQEKPAEQEQKANTEKHEEENLN